MSPTAAGEVAVPAKQRRRRDDQPSPPVAAHESGEPREQGSVGVVQARRLRGAPVDGELVTKDQELRFASEVIPPESKQDPKRRAECEVDESKSKHRRILADPIEPLPHAEPEFRHPSGCYLGSGGSGAVSAAA
jgi:hypothetical protein